MQEIHGLVYYLAQDVSTVRNKSFEMAVNEILNRHGSDVNDDGTDAVKTSSIDENNNGHEKVENLMYFEQIRSKHRNISSASSLYIDCRFVSATKCSVERLFSAASRILTSVQKSLSRITSERLVFTKFYGRLSNINTISSAMKISPPGRYDKLDDDIFYHA